MPRKVTKLLSLLICFCLLFEQTGFAQVAGQIDFSGYINQLRNSFVQDKFRPLHLRYLSYNPEQNNFRLLLDKGDSKDLQKSTIEDTSKKLLNYFLVGVSLPNSTFWVNLRPDSPDNIIDENMARTDVGRIFLEADLQLKKDTAKFTSPETAEGREYWDKLYKKAGEIFGSENITIPTLTRPWIVPDEIIIRETENNAYVYKATLKVLLEQDYLKDSAAYNFKDERLKQLNEYSSQLIRELIVPKLTKEINTAKRYASLRQVYYSLILAQWFKNKFYGKSGVYPSFIDKKDLTGLASAESWSRDTYFQAYQKSFKDGEYNIKEPAYTPYGQVVRSYFSGGLDLAVNLPNGPSLNNPVAVIDATGDRAVPDKGMIEVIVPAQGNPAVVEKTTSLDDTVAMPAAEVNQEALKDLVKSLNEKSDAKTVAELAVALRRIPGAPKADYSGAINGIAKQLAEQTEDSAVDELTTTLYQLAREVVPNADYQKAIEPLAKQLAAQSDENTVENLTGTLTKIADLSKENSEKAIKGLSGQLAKETDEEAVRRLKEAVRRIAVNLLKIEPVIGNEEQNKQFLDEYNNNRDEMIMFLQGNEEIRRELDASVAAFYVRQFRLLGEQWQAVDGVKAAVDYAVKIIEVASENIFGEKLNEEKVRQVRNKILRNEPVKLVFLCSFNKQRSFLGAILADFFSKIAGLTNVKVDSAGVVSAAGPADPRFAAIAKANLREILRAKGRDPSIADNIVDNFVPRYLIDIKALFGNLKTELRDIGKDASIVDNFIPTQTIDTKKFLKELKDYLEGKKVDPSIVDNNLLYPKQMADGAMLPEADLVVVAGSEVADKLKELFPKEFSQFSGKIVYLTDLYDTLAHRFYENMPDFFNYQQKYAENKGLDRAGDLSKEETKKVLKDYYDLIFKAVQEGLFSADQPTSAPAVKLPDNVGSSNSSIHDALDKAQAMINDGKIDGNDGARAWLNNLLNDLRDAQKSGNIEKLMETWNKKMEAGETAPDLLPDQLPVAIMVAEALQQRIEKIPAAQPAAPVAGPDKSLSGVAEENPIQVALEHIAAMIDNRFYGGARGALNTVLKGLRDGKESGDITPLLKELDANTEAFKFSPADISRFIELAEVLLRRLNKEDHTGAAPAVSAPVEPAAPAPAETQQKESKTPTEILRSRIDELRALQKQGIRVRILWHEKITGLSETAEGIIEGLASPDSKNATVSIGGYPYHILLLTIVKIEPLNGGGNKTNAAEAKTSDQQPAANVGPAHLGDIKVTAEKLMQLYWKDKGAAELRKSILAVLEQMHLLFEGKADQLKELFRVYLDSDFINECELMRRYLTKEFGDKDSGKAEQDIKKLIKNKIYASLAIISGDLMGLDINKVILSDRGNFYQIFGTFDNEPFTNQEISPKNILVESKKKVDEFEYSDLAGPKDRDNMVITSIFKHYSPKDGERIFVAARYMGRQLVFYFVPRQDIWRRVETASEGDVHQTIAPNAPVLNEKLSEDLDKKYAEIAARDEKLKEEAKKSGSPLDEEKIIIQTLELVKGQPVPAKEKIKEHNALLQNKLVGEGVLGPGGLKSMSQDWMEQDRQKGIIADQSNPKYNPLWRYYMGIPLRPEEKKDWFLKRYTDDKSTNLDKLRSRRAPVASADETEEQLSIEPGDIVAVVERNARKILSKEIEAFGKDSSSFSVKFLVDSNGIIKAVASEKENFAGVSEELKLEKLFVAIVWVKSLTDAGTPVDGLYEYELSQEKTNGYTPTGKIKDNLIASLNHANNIAKRNIELSKASQLPAEQRLTRPEINLITAMVIEMRNIKSNNLTDYPGMILSGQFDALIGEVISPSCAREFFEALKQYQRMPDDERKHTIFAKAIEGLKTNLRGDAKKSAEFFADSDPAAVINTLFGKVNLIEKLADHSFKGEVALLLPQQPVTKTIGGESAEKVLSRYFAGDLFIQAGKTWFKLWVENDVVNFQRYNKDTGKAEGSIHKFDLYKEYSVGSQGETIEGERYALKSEPGLSPNHFRIQVIKDGNDYKFTLIDANSEKGTTVEWTPPAPAQTVAAESKKEERLRPDAGVINMGAIIEGVMNLFGRKKPAPVDRNWQWNRKQDEVGIFSRRPDGTYENIMERPVNKEAVPALATAIPGVTEKNILMVPLAVSAASECARGVDFDEWDARVGGPILIPRLRDDGKGAGKGPIASSRTLAKAVSFFEVWSAKEGYLGLGAQVEWGKGNIEYLPLRITSKVGPEPEEIKAAQQAPQEPTKKEADPLREFLMQREIVFWKGWAYPINYVFSKEEKHRQGYKVHIAATEKEATEILDIVMRVLSEKGINQWKVLPSTESLKRQNTSFPGNVQLGKFICVYFQQKTDNFVGEAAKIALQNAANEATMVAKAIDDALYQAEQQRGSAFIVPEGLKWGSGRSDASFEVKGGKTKLVGSRAGSFSDLKFILPNGKVVEDRRDRPKPETGMTGVTMPQLISNVGELDLSAEAERELSTQIGALAGPEQQPRVNGEAPGIVGRAKGIAGGLKKLLLVPILAGALLSNGPASGQEAVQPQTPPAATGVQNKDKTVPSAAVQQEDLKRLEEILKKEGLPFSDYMKAARDISQTATQREDLSQQCLKTLENLLRQEGLDWNVYPSVAKAISEIAIQREDLSQQCLKTLESLLEQKVKTGAYSSVAKAISEIAEKQPKTIHKETVLLLENLLKQKDLNLDAYRYLAEAISETAIQREDLSQQCLKALENLLQQEDLNPFAYRSLTEAIRAINASSPELIKAGSLSSVVVSMPKNITQYSLPHFQLYLSASFKEKTNNLSDVARYAVGLTSYRFLKHHSLDLNENNISKAVELILRARENSAQRAVLDEHTKVINIAHSDEHFDLKELKDFETTSKVSPESIQSYKGRQDKGPALKAIAQSDKVKPLTVFFNSHGGPQHLWLDSGEVGKEMSDNLADSAAISYRELGGALLKRGKDLSNVVLLIDACYSYNFSGKLLSYLEKNGVTNLPVVVSAANLDRVTKIGAFLNSLEKVHKSGQPLTLRGIFAAEEMVFEFQDSGVFLPIDKVLIKEHFGQLPQARAATPEKAPLEEMLEISYRRTTGAPAPSTISSSEPDSFADAELAYQRAKLAEQILEKTISDEQAALIQRAHEVGPNHCLGTQNPDGTYNKNEVSNKAYTPQEIAEKARILKEAGFTQSEREDLIKNGVVGNREEASVGERPAKPDSNNIEIEKVDAGQVGESSKNDKKALQATLGVCLAVAALNTETGQGILAHFDPSGRMDTGDDISDKEKVKQRCLEKLLEKVSGPEWQVVIVSSGKDRGDAINVKVLREYLEAKNVKNIQTDEANAAKNVTMKSSGDVEIIHYGGSNTVKTISLANTAQPSQKSQATIAPPKAESAGIMEAVGAGDRNALAAIRPQLTELGGKKGLSVFKPVLKFNAQGEIVENLEKERIFVAFAPFSMGIPKETMDKIQGNLVELAVYELFKREAEDKPSRDAYSDSAKILLECINDVLKQLGIMWDADIVEKDIIALGSIALREKKKLTEEKVTVDITVNADAEGRIVQEGGTPVELTMKAPEGKFVPPEAHINIRKAVEEYNSNPRQAQLNAARKEQEKTQRVETPARQPGKMMPFDVSIPEKKTTPRGKTMPFEEEAPGINGSAKGPAGVEKETPDKQELEININSVSLSSRDPDSWAKYIQLLLTAKALLVNVPRGELLDILRNISGNKSLTWDDLGKEVLLSFHREGTHKHVFKVEFTTNDSKRIKILLAAKKAKEKDDISSHEFQNLKRLKGRGVPVFGGAFKTEDGRYWYIEEFIEGETAGALQKQGKFTKNIARNIVATLMSIAFILNGMCPRDIHGENFIVRKGSEDVVMVDIGDRRLYITGKDAAAKARTLFLASLVAQYGERKDLSGNEHIFEVILQDKHLKEGEGREFLRQVQEELEKKGSAEMAKVFYQEGRTMFHDFGATKDNLQSLVDFSDFLLASLKLYLAKVDSRRGPPDQPAANQAGLSAPGAQTAQSDRRKQAEQVLGRPITDAQAAAIQQAHLIGQDKGHGYIRNPDGSLSKNTDPSKAYTSEEIAEKARILKEAGFTQLEREALIKNGVVGNSDEEILVAEPVITLTGPFSVNGLNCSLGQITDSQEMKRTLDAWFSSETKRYFGRSQWDSEIRIHTRGSKLFKLQAENGELLGIAHAYITPFMFADGSVQDVYFGGLMEISEGNRGNKLGRVLVAKMIESSFNDPDIAEDAKGVIGVHPAEDSEYAAEGKQAKDFFEDLGFAPLPASLNNEAEEDDAGKNLYYTISQKMAQLLVNKVKEDFENLTPVSIEPAQVGKTPYKGYESAPENWKLYVRLYASKYGITKDEFMRRLNGKRIMLVGPDTDELPNQLAQQLDKSTIIAVNPLFKTNIEGRVSFIGDTIQRIGRYPVGKVDFIFSSGLFNPEYTHNIKGYEWPLEANRVYVPMFRAMKEVLAEDGQIIIMAGNWGNYLLKEPAGLAGLAEENIYTESLPIYRFTHLKNQPQAPDIAGSVTGPPPSAAKADPSSGSIPDENTGDASQGSGSIPDKQVPGGIDFRALPIITQPMPKPGLAVPPLSRNVPANLNNEWQQIQNMITGGIIPSTERIKEYLANRCEKESFDKEIDKVLSCIADILRLEEERVSSTEPALKEMLALLESDSPSAEFQVSLKKIDVLPQEPQTIDSFVVEEKN